MGAQRSLCLLRARTPLRDESIDTHHCTRDTHTRVASVRARRGPGLPRARVPAPSGHTEAHRGWSPPCVGQGFEARHTNTTSPGYGEARRVLRHGPARRRPVPPAGGPLGESLGRVANAQYPVRPRLWRDQTPVIALPMGTAQRIRQCVLSLTTTPPDSNSFSCVNPQTRQVVKTGLEGRCSVRVCLLGSQKHNKVIGYAQIEQR